MKNTIKFPGIILLAAAGFCMLACDQGGNSSRSSSDFFLANLKAPDGLTSVYLSDIPVKGSGRAATGGAISSLSYITSTGNAPVLFSTAGKKQYIFEVTSLEQLGERCIIICIDGYYEVTSTGAAGSYTVGDKVDTWEKWVWDEKTNTDIFVKALDSVLIDMKNNKLYDFSEFQDRWGNSTPRFMEGNIIYTLKREWNNTSGERSTVYKIDLSTATAGSALQAVPLNNSAFESISGIELPYTINNKLLAGGMCLDILGTIRPQKYNSPVLATDDLPDYTGSDTQNITVNILNPGTLIRDLTYKPWAFITYSKDSPYTPLSDSRAQNYFIADVSIDDTGQCTLNIEKNGELAFNNYPNYSGSQLFTFNAAGVGSAYYYNYYSNDRDSYRLRSYLNNGIVTISANGFIRLYPEVDGIRVESLKLSMPAVSLLGRSVISSEDYLFWLENQTIKRQKLAAGGTAEVIYSNSGIIENSRDLTASGRKLIFYQYAAGSATEVHTFSLDMYTPGAQPELLATNDAVVRSIVELDF